MNNKAIIFDIQRSSYNDGPGIRTTVFFKGCPLRCLWCHNPESQSFSKQLFYYSDRCDKCGKCVSVCENEVNKLQDGIHTINFDLCNNCGKCIEVCPSNALKFTGKEMSVEDVMDVVLLDVDFYRNSGGGITLSGGEPLSHFSFAKELLERSKEKGINTCVETSGYISSDKFKEILPLIDVLLFDYKVTGAGNHKIYTGKTNKLILKNLDIAYHSGVPIILRCPVIQGINDTIEHFRAIKSLEKKYPKLLSIEILPYHSGGNEKRINIGVDKTLQNLRSAPPQLSKKWLDQLIGLKCKKVRLG